jgi:Uma2 family endonuclease
MGTTTLISLDQFERHEGPDHLELLKGELIQVPPPQRKHMEICHNLYELLKAAVDRWRKANPDTTSFGKVYIEMGYKFPGDVQSWLRPDVSLTHAAQSGDRFYEGAPLIAFEIVSENDTAKRLEGKVAVYLANGAAEVWVIYPDTRHAWVYHRSTPSARRETRSIRSELLPGIEIPLADIL